MFKFLGYFDENATDVETATIDIHLLSHNKNQPKLLVNKFTCFECKTDDAIWPTNFINHNEMKKISLSFSFEAQIHSSGNKSKHNYKSDANHFVQRAVNALRQQK